MARFTSTETYAAMTGTGLVPVFYHRDPDVVKEALGACFAGGVRVFEFTNRGDAAHELFAELVKWSARECPAMIVGAGSVVDAPTAALYMQSGANFIVGPLFDPAVSEVCNRRCIPYIPGCATPTEIGRAQQSGVQIVKIFPGDAAGGPAFVKSVKAPMPWTRVMVTGGVDAGEENLSQWFGAGVECVGMGSNLFTRERVEGGKWEEITRSCRDILKIISRCHG